MILGYAQRRCRVKGDGKRNNPCMHNNHYVFEPWCGVDEWGLLLAKTLDLRSVTTCRKIKRLTSRHTYQTCTALPTLIDKVYHQWCQISWAQLERGMGCPVPDLQICPLLDQEAGHHKVVVNGISLSHCKQLISNLGDHEWGRKKINMRWVSLELMVTFHIS